MNEITIATPSKSQAARIAKALTAAAIGFDYRPARKHVFFIDAKDREAASRIIMRMNDGTSVYATMR